jgi:hypothetical protein
MLRGLHFVQVYAAVEFSVTAALQETLRQVATVQPPLATVKLEFHAVSSNHLFQSLSDGKGKRLKKRLELLRAQTSPDLCRINDSMFSDLLQNVTSEFLVDVCDCFCISLACLGEESNRRYIDEIVERRNAVAHGRESALDVGARQTSANLEQRLITSQLVIDEFVTALDLLLANRSFLRP